MQPNGLIVENKGLAHFFIVNKARRLPSKEAGDELLSLGGVYYE